jgi:UDP-glucose:glycoprotein glucosyltransferase
LFNTILRQDAPLRVGILPYFNLGDRLSRNVGYAFHYLAGRNESLAVNFLTRAIEYVGINEKTDVLRKPTEAHFASAFSEITASDPDLIRWSDLHTLFDMNSPETRSIIETHAAIASVGVSYDIAFLNGHPLDMSHGAQGVVQQAVQMARLVHDCVKEQPPRDLASLDVGEALSRHRLFIPNLDTHALDSRTVGLRIIHKKLPQQIDFLNFLSRINWTAIDDGNVLAYYILFSKDTEMIRDFRDFETQDHLVPSAFALNPPISSSLAALLGLDLTATQLIASGRVLTNFTAARLRVLDSLAAKTTAAVLRPAMADFPERQTALFMVTVMADWIAEGIVRQRFDADVWKTVSPLIYVQTKRGMLWELFLDPFTRNFQRVADLVEFVDRTGALSVRLAAIPPRLANAAPVTYYRGAFSAPRAVFALLDDTTTYSAILNVPDSWIVESMRAAFDLDNILLSDFAPGGHIGKYILTNLKAEGVCGHRDGKIAQGAELALFDARERKRAETVVMIANGYWQLSAPPGEWTINLGGRRSRIVYEPLSYQLVIASFAPDPVTLSLGVNPGMEDVKVRDLAGDGARNTSTVNVFSVASGHLYERLLKIMMLSVRNHSRHNVKFWIMRGFLSPQFKATLPKMAARYNFTYELIGYKWPLWLLQQTEKQRIIWGNKILFLDVIFPLDLDRVVYIDSDQVVRTDLIDLMRMDFGDAPYAFPPMCETRPETAPFRFWKQGYWAEKLGDKYTYHISALFAIDFPKFRALAAGDSLRSHYQALSQDAGSLSNLDQDLPNFAQLSPKDAIPIFSLPRDWLWCETWCSDESMSRARTIDLCNNPLTRKPKLYIAQTRIKEWPALDREARNITADTDDYEKTVFR